MKTTKTKLSMLIAKHHMSVADIAKHTALRHKELVGVVFLGNEPSASVITAVGNMVIALDLCPECLSKVRREGGCSHCTCGWSLC